MKALLAVCTAALMISAVMPAGAAAASAKPLTAQQTLMKTCNAGADEQKLKGDARKTFVKDCLAGKTAANATTTMPAATTPTAAASAPAKPSQQEVMKTCNASATTQGLKGDARKAFMKTCLSGGPTQFANDTDAKSHCPTDLVVWVNLDTKIYHFAGTGDYGKTKKGTYMCRKDADAAGDKVAANEKPPAH